MSLLTVTELCSRTELAIECLLLEHNHAIAEKRHVPKHEIAERLQDAFDSLGDAREALE